MYGYADEMVYNTTNKRQESQWPRSACMGSYKRGTREETSRVFILAQTKDEKTDIFCLFSVQMARCMVIMYDKTGGREDKGAVMRIIHA